MQRIVNELREFDDSYEYCIIKDYEDKYAKFSCEAIQIGDVFVNLLETKGKTVLCSIHFFKEHFTLDEIPAWLDRYSVNYDMEDPQGYFVENASEIVEKVLFKNKPVVVYKRGNTAKLYFDVEDTPEVTDMYIKYNMIVNTADAKHVSVNLFTNFLVSSSREY